MIRIAMLLLAGAVGAASAAASERREHTSHEHGHAELEVVLESAALAMRLQAPGMDMVGFEHAPRDETDKARIASAMKRLEDVSGLFIPTAAAGCTVTEAHAEHHVLQTSAHDDHGHDHSKGRDGEHKHEQKLDQVDRGDGHAGFEAHYKWACANPTALTGVTVKYFEVFSSTRVIEAMILGPSGQSLLGLTPAKPDIVF